MHINVTEMAARFVQQYDEVRGPVPAWAQALNVVGEAGEMAEAYRRATGHARRSSTMDEVADEMADVVIATYVFAQRVGVDLDEAIAAKYEKIMSRGFDHRSV